MPITGRPGPAGQQIMSGIHHHPVRAISIRGRVDNFSRMVKNDKTYTIKYKGHDNSRDDSEAENGNIESENTKTFTYDTQRAINDNRPAAPNGLTINSLPTISGTAEDPGQTPISR